MTRMSLVLGFGHHTGTRLAEVGFLLLLFAGVWLTAAQIPALRFATARTIVAGVALTISGVLLIIAVHWGHFG
jgi:ribosomal protein L16/L10AE